MTWPITFALQKWCRWSPQVPEPKTADFRGMSWLINSSCKWECSPPAQTDTRHRLPGSPEGMLAPAHPELLSVMEISGTTCSNAGLVCDLSVRTASVFMWQRLNPPLLLWLEFKWALMTLKVSRRKTREMKDMESRNLTQLQRRMTGPKTFTACI